MSPEVIAILSVGATVGVGLGGLIISGNRSLRAGLEAATVERASIRQDLHALAERVARIEGALSFLVRQGKASEPAA